MKDKSEGKVINGVFHIWNKGWKPLTLESLTISFTAMRNVSEMYQKRYEFAEKRLEDIENVVIRGKMPK